MDFMAILQGVNPVLIFILLCFAGLIVMFYRTMQSMDSLERTTARSHQELKERFRVLEDKPSGAVAGANDEIGRLLQELIAQQKLLARGLRELAACQGAPDGESGKAPNELAAIQDTLETVLRKQNEAATTIAGLAGLASLAEMSGVIPVSSRAAEAGPEKPTPASEAALQPEEPPVPEMPEQPEELAPQSPEANIVDFIDMDDKQPEAAAPADTEPADASQDMLDDDELLDVSLHAETEDDFVDADLSGGFADMHEASPADAMDMTFPSLESETPTDQQEEESFDLDMDMDLDLGGEPAPAPEPEISTEETALQPDVAGAPDDFDLDMDMDLGLGGEPAIESAPGDAADSFDAAGDETELLDISDVSEEPLFEEESAAESETTAAQPDDDFDLDMDLDKSEPAKPESEPELDDIDMSSADASDLIEADAFSLDDELGSVAGEDARATAEDSEELDFSTDDFPEMGLLDELQPEAGAAPDSESVSIQDAAAAFAGAAAKGAALSTDDGLEPEEINMDATLEGLKSPSVELEEETSPGLQASQAQDEEFSLNDIGMDDVGMGDLDTADARTPETDEAAETELEAMDFTLDDAPADHAPAQSPAPSPAAEDALDFTLDDLQAEPGLGGEAVPQHGASDEDELEVEFMIDEPSPDTPPQSKRGDDDDFDINFEDINMTDASGNEQDAADYLETVIDFKEFDDIQLKELDSDRE